MSKFYQNVAMAIACIYTLSFANGASLPKCTLVNGNDFYDLSSLAEKDYFTYEEKLKYKDFNVNFYLSVCHPIRNLPTGKHCSTENSGVCVEKVSKNESLDINQRFMEVVTPNAGITPESFTVHQQGWIEYVYSDGTPCNYYTRTTNYTTTLNLLCPAHGSEESAGPLLMSFPRCENIFAWLTKAACPVKYNETKVTTCVDKFLDTNQTLNLHALHSLSYYNASAASSSYQLNICGAIEGGTCGGRDATVCDVTDPQNPKVLSKTNDMEVMWHGKFFKLHYNSNSTNTLSNGQKEVSIQFFCDRQAHKTSMFYVTSNETHIEFAAQTAAVCTPQEPKCVIKDRKGNVFDLRPLHKTEENWEVLDQREDHRDVLYSMNICGAVNEVHYYACPLGNIGACQTSMNTQTAYNLGFVTSDPIINEDGTVTVVYTGGDSCHHGKHTRSSRITLVCDSIEHEPLFVEETDSCEYVFMWLTPMACPKHVVVSDTCQVKDPLFGYTYDISPLRNMVKDYTTSDGTSDYFVNVCGPLVGKYGDLPAGASIAMTQDRDYHSGGNSPAKLIFNDGTVTMQLEDGSDCSDDEKRSSQIIFLCDHESQEANSGLSVFRHSSSCKLNFSWRTKYVCPPHDVIDCSVTTQDGLKYNLNPLSIGNMNYEELSPDNEDKYVLNVCRSVIHSKTARCAYNAGACLIDETDTKPPVSIGVVGKGPYIQNGLLKLKYENGDQCDGMQRYSSEIAFECDASNYFPYPNLITMENCKYEFEWKTKFACPEKVNSFVLYGNCSARNAYSKYLFDLSPLKRSEGYEVTHGDVSLRLNVCDKLLSCSGHGSGACVKGSNDTDFVSAGEANGELNHIPGTLTLQYRNGSPCRNSRKRKTLISFYCGAENAMEGPVLVSVDEDSCTYFVNWHTELACEHRISCFAVGFNRTVDLRPLINHDSNYEVTDPAHPDDKFYINMCRSLNHVSGRYSVAGSAAGLYYSNGSSISLGKPLTPPIHGAGDSVTMLYSLGSTCHTTPGYKYSTRIKFLCDRSAGLGSPRFLEFSHDCQYQFEWRTALVCNPEDPESSCHIRHDEAKTNLQLSPLYKENGYRVPHGGKVYYINVCGSVCKTSGVCTDTGVSYGQSKHSQFKWDHGKLKLVYYGGDKCDSSLSGTRATAIYFECDMTAGFGRPEADVLMYDLDCMAVFNWRTNMTCMETIYSTTSTTTTPVTITPAVTTISPDNNYVTPNGHKQQPGGLPTAATVALVVMLSAVVGLVVYAVRSGAAHRLLNRAKLATATTRYSSRQGLMLLEEDV